MFLMLASLFLLSKHTFAVPLAEFYPFGSEAGDEALLRNDDGSSPAITVPYPFIFFGYSFQNIFVSFSFI